MSRTEAPRPLLPPFFEMEQEKAAERAATALGVFEAEARHAGISYECRSIAELPGDGAASIGATARLYDPHSCFAAGR
jgi:hypothetical protein